MHTVVDDTPSVIGEGRPTGHEGLNGEAATRRPRSENERIRLVNETHKFAQ
jgi:hypothetical protein